ncbi:hypothetical protein AN403_6001 [Pseudomonas fluorescens]|uniref:Uncharacterized protein n=1 Tax=Pseudomonas fluorescens TaxID=294 RepID=A0A0N8NY40_PSEFL|nr:hypothetical protein AN403_6001 [Pseudomonas fluorescens]
MRFQDKLSSTCAAPTAMQWFSHMEMVIAVEDECGRGADLRCWWQSGGALCPPPF